MSNIKIHGHVMSTCTRRVATVCNELGLKYEIVTVDITKGANKAPDYTESMHPFGLVPVLEDTDGTKIYESRAIARYLVVKYGKDSGLIPPTSDVKAYGLFEQAASIEYSAFDPFAGGLARERIYYPMIGAPTTEVLANHYETTLKAKFEGYDRILAKQKYLAGEHITLADLFHLPYGSWLDRIDPGLIGSKPNLKRWWNDVSSRESWKVLN
ncbi:glutathione S-transferase [Ceratobasidium sp. AG-Ba]|nr:glutathione S-transferase [Ceratobasidium sp. AG-Ba]QRW07769.1 glutathione S-transferase [Ceratobasidium sp. AG-Ba]